MTNTCHGQTEAAFITSGIAFGGTLGHRTKLQHLDHFLSCTFYLTGGDTLDASKVAQMFASRQILP
jgi:hypothetical protein